MGTTTTTTLFDRWILFMFWVFVLVCGCVQSLVAGHFYEWDVHYMFWSPDGVENVVMAINNQFPGPKITATAGEIIHVRLRNNLSTEGVVIHWHGIRQKGTPWADGTASISQCAINPGETFDYRFEVDRAGTYFYHGHYGMQRSAGLYGLLIVNEKKRVKEPFKFKAPYGGDRSLLLSDWWHQSVHHQELGLSSKKFHWIGEPQSILINGRGQYNCSLAAHLNSSLNICNITGAEQWAPDILHLHPKTTYRLRIASTTALASLNFSIQGHKMTVVEADGNYVQPFVTDSLAIYSGESYSVLFETDQDLTKMYWISASPIGRTRSGDTPQALTLLNYTTNSKSKFPDSLPPATPKWDDYDSMKEFSKKIYALERKTPKVPDHYHRRIVLLNTQNLINGYKRWAINNISLTLPPTPYLGTIRFGLGGYDTKPPPENFDRDYDVMKKPKNPNAKYGNGVYMMQYESTVDVILQNANMDEEGQSEIHPWHLHGHDFWVLGYGEGKFKEGVDDAKFNSLDKPPPYRNTAILFPHGWTALRFKADNPGVWAFHCHIEPHLHMGMGVIFAEGMDHLSKIPKQALACGLTSKELMKHSHLGD